METLNMQDKLRKMIQTGDIVPTGEKAKKPTIFIATTGKKDVTLQCDANGRLYDTKSKKPFVIK
jgi:hypothetical protein